MDAVEQVLPVKFFCNGRVLAMRLREKGVEICFLPYFRNLVLNRSYDLGAKPKLEQFILVLPEDNAHLGVLFLETSLTRETTTVVRVSDPDAYIFRELSRLRDTVAVALTEAMPDHALLDQWTTNGLRLILVRKTAPPPAVLTGLMEHGLQGVYALSRFTRPTFAVTPNMKTVYDVVADREITAQGAESNAAAPDTPRDDDGPNRQPTEPVTDGDEPGAGSETAPQPILAASGEISGPAELAELARELPPKVTTIADNDVTAAAPLAEAQPNGGRAIIVVDAQNFNKAMNTSFAAPGRQINIDFLKLREILAKRFAVVGAYFVSRHAQTTGSIKFFEALRKRGYEMIVPETRLQPGDSWDDLQIIDNLPRWAADVETVILVSGDGGYIRALSELAEAGKKIVIAFLAGSTHQKLKAFDEFIDLTNYRDDLCRGDREQPSPAKIIGNYRLVIEVDAPLSQGPAIQQLLSEWMANPAWAELGLHPTIDFSFSNRLPK